MADEVKGEALSKMGTKDFKRRHTAKLKARPRSAIDLDLPPIPKTESRAREGEYLEVDKAEAKDKVQ